MNDETQFTPTLRGATLGNGNLRGEFTKRGRLVNWRMWFELGTTSTVDGPIELTLYYTGPVTWGLSRIGVGVLNTNTGSTWLHSTSPTEPFAWSTGDSIRLDGIHLSTEAVAG